MKYLITGSAGFIGSHFCRYMINKHPKDSFVGLDVLSYAADLRRVEDLKIKHNFQQVRGDITNERFIRRLFYKHHFDKVINFAAESHVARSIDTPYKTLRTNVEGVRVLLDACHASGSEFHQISTDEVYGASQKVASTELSSLNPSTPYAASKAAADLLALSYYRTYGLPVTITRSSNNYGTHQHSEKLIPLMVLKAIKNEPLTVHGDGSMTRNWLHVLDHCEAIDKVIQDGTRGEVYNITGKTEKSVLEIVDLILTKIPESRSLIQYVANRKGNDYAYCVSSDKVISLGWKEKQVFTEEMSGVIDWYRRFYNAKI